MNKSEKILCVLCGERVATKQLRMVMKKSVILVDLCDSCASECEGEEVLDDEA